MKETKQSPFAKPHKEITQAMTKRKRESEKREKEEQKERKLFRFNPTHRTTSYCFIGSSLLIDL